MQVRFACPACKTSHVLDMPETTIHMTCGRTGAHLMLTLGVSGEVKARIISDGPSASEEQSAESGE